MFRRLSYHTSLGLEECLRELRRTAGEHRWSTLRLWQPLPEGTIQATVLGRAFLLSAWPRPYTRNSFVQMFHGVIRETAGGASITGRYVFHPLVMLFLAVWFGGALFGLIVALVLVPLQRGASGPGPADLVAIPLVLGVVSAGVIIVALGARAGRRQRDAIEGFLQHRLDASRVEPSEGGQPRVGCR